MQIKLDRHEPKAVMPQFRIFKGHREYLDRLSAESCFSVVDIARMIIAQSINSGKVREIVGAVAAPGFGADKNSGGGDELG